MSKKRERIHDDLQNSNMLCRTQKCEKHRLLDDCVFIIKLRQRTFYDNTERSTHFLILYFKVIVCPKDTKWYSTEIFEFPSKVCCLVSSLSMLSRLNFSTVFRISNCFQPTWEAAARFDVVGTKAVV
jgi:hypothetical protein